MHVQAYLGGRIHETVCLQKLVSNVLTAYLGGSIQRWGHIQGFAFPRSHVPDILGTRERKFYTETQNVKE